MQKLAACERAQTVRQVPANASTLADEALDGSSSSTARRRPSALRFSFCGENQRPAVSCCCVRVCAMCAAGCAVSLMPLAVGPATCLLVCSCAVMLPSARVHTPRNPSTVLGFALLPVCGNVRGMCCLECSCVPHMACSVARRSSSCCSRDDQLCCGWLCMAEKLLCMPHTPSPWLFCLFAEPTCGGRHASMHLYCVSLYRVVTLCDCAVALSCSSTAGCRTVCGCMHCQASACVSRVLQSTLANCVRLYLCCFGVCSVYCCVALLCLLLACSPCSRGCGGVSCCGCSIS